MPRRKDATLVPGISKYQELAFHVMPHRTNSVVYYTLQVEVDNAVKYLKELNGDKEFIDSVTIFHVVLAG